MLDQIRVGDVQARSDLVARVEPLLRRFARGHLSGHLRTEQDTADLVKLTWLKVLDKLEPIDACEPGAFSAYLRAVLINALRESLRRNARAPVDHGLDLDLIASDVGADDWLDWEQSLALLSNVHRGLVLMRFVFGMRFVEIADELGEAADGGRMKFNRAIAHSAAAMLGKLDDGEAQRPIRSAEQEHDQVGRPFPSSALRGDLDAIVAQALRARPENRHGSVAELSSDTERHLDARPVFARTPSRRYRLTRFARRNRLAVILAALIVSVLIGGALVSMRQVQHAGTAYAQIFLTQIEDRRLRFGKTAHMRVIDLPSPAFGRWRHSTPR